MSLTKYVVGLKLGHENVLEGAAALAQAGPVARVLCEPDLLQQLHLLIVFVHLSQTWRRIERILGGVVIIMPVK